MSNNSIRDLDYLTMLGTFLGVLNYIDNSKEVSNGVLLDELNTQTDKYLNTIIEQNNQILKLLKEEKLNGDA